MIRLSIGKKIFYGFLVIIFLAVLISLISYPYLLKIDVLSSRVLPLERETNILERCSEEVRLLENKIELYLIIGSPEARDEVLATTRRLKQLSRELLKERDLKNLPQILELITQISQTATTLVGHLERGESAYKINLQLFTVVKYIKNFQETQKTLQRQNLKESLSIVTKEKTMIKALLNIFLILEVAIVILGFLAAFFLTRLITRNLSRLSKATQEIARGNFQIHLDVSSADEIGQLADSFNTMVAELRERTVSRDYLDSIINRMADMLVVVDYRLRISSLNKAICVLLGYDEHELRDEPIRKILSPQSLSISEAEFEKRIRGSGLINYEMCYRRKDGLDIPVLFSSSVVKDNDGSISYIICTALDITAHKRAEEKEKEAVEMKAKLTSMVSYDMRARLTAINTGIYLLLSGKGEAVGRKQKGLLELIQRNSGKLLHLINNFLDFSKLQVSKMEFVIEESNINEVIKEIYQEMKPLVEGKGLTFSLELFESLPRIKFDRERIAQVLINLISNAVDYTEKGKITIATQPDKEGIRVAVSDTGMGINADEMQRIFVSFEQIQYPGNEGLRGTALGLAICKEIIEKHKGKMGAESEVKKGSVFYFTLPY